MCRRCGRRGRRWFRSFVTLPHDGVLRACGLNGVPWAMRLHASVFRTGAGRSPLSIYRSFRASVQSGVPLTRNATVVPVRIYLDHNATTPVADDVVDRIDAALRAPLCD